MPLCNHRLRRKETVEVPDTFYIKELANGLTLLGQTMPNVSSAAITIVSPAGAAHDEPGAEGAAAVAGEWLFRGAGERDTRQFNDALDSLGAQHSSSVQSEHLHFASVQLGRNLPQVLSIFADVLRRPMLQDATFSPCQDLTLQDLESLEDEPAHKCSMMLRENFYPHPLGRCIYGREESLRNLTPGKVREHLSRHFGPRGAIIAVAGNVDWTAFCDLVEKLLGDWTVQPGTATTLRTPQGGITHVEKDTAQQHISLAHVSVPMRDSRYYAARLAETVLSGGMSSRLFTEVREKRGLAYDVSSRYHSLRDYAGMFTHAGTRPDQAQITLDVLVHEIRRMEQGVTDEELTRAKTQLKSNVVMQGESTMSRSSSLAGDWFHLGRLRTLAQVCDAINTTTADDVKRYLHEFPGRNFTLLTVGPQKLDTGIVSEA